MKAAALQENLAKGIAIASRAVARRTYLPVLTHILIKTTQTGLLLAGTDLELFISCTVRAKIEEPGGIAVPALPFGDLVKSLPRERIDLDLDGNVLHVTCDRNEASFNGIPADEFPTLPEITGGPLTQIEPDLLGRDLGRVLFAASANKSRPVLTGVLMRSQDGNVTMASVDGFRLSVLERKAGEMPEKPVDLLVPAKALAKVAKLCADERERIEIYADGDSRAIFKLRGDAGANEGRVTDIIIASQLIEGNFINYAQIVPKSHATRTVVEQQAFLKACKTSWIFARSEANTVHLDIKPGDNDNAGNIRLLAESLDFGNSEVELEAEIEGAPLAIAFNVAFLMEAVSAMDSARLALETRDSGLPAVLRPVGDDSYTHVITPVCER